MFRQYVKIRRYDFKTMKIEKRLLSVASCNCPKIKRIQTNFQHAWTHNKRGSIKKNIIRLTERYTIVSSQLSNQKKGNDYIDTVRRDRTVRTYMRIQRCCIAKYWFRVVTIDFLSSRASSPLSSLFFSYSSPVHSSL